MDRITFEKGDKIRLIKEWNSLKFPVGSILTVGTVSVVAHGTFIYPQETLDKGETHANVDSNKVVKLERSKFWKE